MTPEELDAYQTYGFYEPTDEEIIQEQEYLARYDGLRRDQAPDPDEELAGSESTPF